MRVPYSRLEFHWQHFENLLQWYFDAFAAAVRMTLMPLLSRPLLAAILMLWVSAGLKSRCWRVSGCSTSSILAVWHRPVSGWRSRWWFRRRLVCHFGCGFLDVGWLGSRLPQNVLQKAKHVSPNQVLMDTRRSFSVLAPGQLAFSRPLSMRFIRVSRSTVSGLNSHEPCH
jgi:hypothetical protein